VTSATLSIWHWFTSPHHPGLYFLSRHGVSGSLSWTRSSAVAERSRDASCHWIFRLVTSRSLDVIQNEYGTSKSLLVFQSNYVFLWDTQCLPHGATWNFWLKVTQSHWKWYHRQIRVDELKRRLIDVWCSLEQSIFDETIDQWRGRHRTCVRAKGGHFEYSLWTDNVDFVHMTFNVTCLTVTSLITKSYQQRSIHSCSFYKVVQLTDLRYGSRCYGTLCRS